jgi:hypothetical protein
VAPVVFVTVVAALSYGSTRFRVAAEPAIVTLASVTLVRAWEWLRARARERRVEAPAAAA